jgi:hypothetical protein
MFGDRIADSTVSVHQYLYREVVPMSVHASQLPTDAVHQHINGSVTSIDIDGHFPVKVVLIPATQR